MYTKLEQPLTAKETLSRISKQWARIRDIMDIGYVGYTKATYIFDEITEQLEKQGYNLPSKLVPMEYVVDYFKINVSYLKKVSEKG